jgi:hypothetical protein
VLITRLGGWTIEQAIVAFLKLVPLGTYIWILPLISIAESKMIPKTSVPYELTVGGDEDMLAVIAWVFMMKRHKIMMYCEHMVDIGAWFVFLKLLIINLLNIYLLINLVVAC